MTATISLAGVAADTVAGMSAGGAEIANEAKTCKGGNSQNEDIRQDTNAKEGHLYDDDRDGVGGGSSGGGARGGENKTQQQKRYHISKTTHYHHHENSHDHLQNNHRHQQGHGHGDAYQLVPPDGGWAWMVALGTFINMTLQPITIICVNVLFSEYFLGTGTSSTTTAWIFNLQGFLFDTSALLARPLTQEFGWRCVALTGSAMTAAGIMISAFTPSPSFLFFSFSILTGCGAGVVTCQCSIILPHYFQRRLGLANGIMMSGVPMGQLVTPPVIRFLQVSYGFRGAALILGAMVLNACVAASLFHPFEWHQKKMPLKEIQEDTLEIPTKTTTVCPPDLTPGLVHSPSEMSFSVGNTKGEIKGCLVEKEKLLKSLEGGNVTCSSASSRCSSTVSLSSLGMGRFAPLPMEDKKADDYHEEGGQRDILPLRVMRSLIRDLGVLKSLRVWILCLGDTMCIIGHINFLMMVPFAMLEAGFSLDTAAWCISLSAGCNMVARFLTSSLSDWPCVNKRIVYIFGFALITTSIFAFTFVSSVEGLIVIMVVYGIGVGANKSMFNLVVIDVTDVEHLGPVLGTTSFFLAFGFICIGPLIGFIRDVTQSYAVSMRVAGGLLLVAMTGWLCMGLAKRVDRRREENKTLTEALQKT